MSTTIFSLPDLVLLEIFQYLSCEDLLYGFVDLHNVRFMNLIQERGAFQQICLSKLPRDQYYHLANEIWRYDLVRSLICNEVFSDCIVFLLQSQLFPSLVDLRIHFIRFYFDLGDFIISHGSTLTHLSIKCSEEIVKKDLHEPLIRQVLPHLSRLKLLDTDWKHWELIQWNQLVNYIQSLEHLITHMISMSEVYPLMLDGILPCLKSLRITVDQAVIKTDLYQSSHTSRLHIPNLETFVLKLNPRSKEQRNEQDFKWIDLDILTSRSVMPRLQQYLLTYTLLSSDEIRDISQSILFNNDSRNVRVKFEFNLFTETLIDSFDIDKICNIYPSQVLLYTVERKVNGYKWQYTWFTSSWPKYLGFVMYNDYVAPHDGVRRVSLRGSNISLNSIAKLFTDATQLEIEPSSSLLALNSSILQLPLINICRLKVTDVIPGLEYLFDGIILPHLKYIKSTTLALFVAFTNQSNSMKILRTVDQLVIVEHNEKSFSLKQWYLVFDAFPRLKILSICIIGQLCPPMGLAELCINYIKQTIRSPLTLFSFGFSSNNLQLEQKNLINYLEEKILTECSFAQPLVVGSRYIDVWM